ncbi:DNA-directed DNA polymerase [Tanacetum coccineum]
MGPIPRMTPAAGIKAIDELSKHSLSWYKEEEYKENDFDKVLKHINDFEHNINVLNEEVRMVKHQYKTPNDERDSLLEEIVSSFIKEAHWRQKKSESFVWRNKRNYDRTFKNQASAIKTIEKNLSRIAESIHGRGVGTLPSFTEINPRGLAHPITTRIVLNKVPPKENDPGGALKPTRICIELANKTTQFPKGIAENVVVKIDKFVFPIYFVILDMEEDHKIPIILGRPFLATTHAMIDVFNKKISFKVRDEIITFDLKKSMRFAPYDEDTYFNNPALFAANSIDKEIPTPKLKELPSHLEYAFLDNNRELPVIVSSLLSNQEKRLLLEVLTKHKKALAWKISDIKGINPSFCTQKILMEENSKPTVQPQRRLNPKVQDVPKKGGTTMITNKDNELIPTRTVTGWRVCIDYRKLKDATRKYHFPLPFIDQMLERLSEKEYYCFLDGFSGYFQIPLAPEDQEKTTFTCPYGTFAYRRMPFGLCNAPATFQRCMTAIFHDMCKDFMEVFMDDFSEFTIEIKDKKGTENLAVDHLSRHENPGLEELNKDTIQDNFPDEHLMVIKLKNIDTDL